MGLLEFDKLPINTLVGADWKTFKAVTGQSPFRCCPDRKNKCHCYRNK